MPKRVLTDACFWIALVDPKEERHLESVATSEILEKYEVLIPWPCMYETVCTKMAGKSDCLERFEKLLDNRKVIPLEDEGYRDQALIESFKMNRGNRKGISLADCVIREILKSENQKISFFISFDGRAGFADLCKKANIELID
jgi:predicted nucleic acid-binding protein